MQALCITFLKMYICTKRKLYSDQSIFIKLSEGIYDIVLKYVVDLKTFTTIPVEAFVSFLCCETGTQWVNIPN